jgi:glutamate synthase (NADPH/NADH) large chain
VLSPHQIRPAEGLYDPQNEHDACGVAFVATLTGEASNDIVVKGLTALRNLDHRGAVGAEENTGDGAGILMQTPDRFLRDVAGVELPPVGEYAAGMAFLPLAPTEAEAARTKLEGIAAEEGLCVLGWREVPVNPDILGSMAKDALPSFALLFVTAADQKCAGLELDRLTFGLRKRAEHELGVYFPSLSARTLV